MSKKMFAGIAIMGLMLMFSGKAFGQGKGNRRVAGKMSHPTNRGGSVSTNRNRAPKPANLGDTGTHEVGHRGKRRIQSPAGQITPQTSGQGTHRKQAGRAKNQDIEVENDETHRSRTETVDNNETITKTRKNRRQSP